MKEKIKKQTKERTYGYTKTAFTLFLSIAAVIMPLLFFIPSAQAEVTKLESPIIWGLDKSSTYILPKLENGFYFLDEFIATSGQISSITANWEAKGKVNLEVSADNGLHFYPIVNGATLKSEFISGNRLLWRAQALSDDAKLISLKIYYSDSSGVRDTFGEPALSGFKYRKAITLTNVLGEDLYNYQIKFKVADNSSVKVADINCNSRIRTDFKDLRFAASDAQTPLVYYLESIANVDNGKVASVWVKVPQIPAKSSLVIYLYYGNADAEDLSNPEKVFDFYEDFQGKALNSDKWVAHVEQKGNIALTAGQIKLDAAELIAKDFRFKEGIIEYSCQLASGFENSLNIRNKTADTYDNPVWLAYSSAYKGAEHCIALDGIVKANDAAAKPTVTGQGYSYRITLLDNKITFERADAVSKELQATVDYQSDSVLSAGYLSLRSGGDGNGTNVMDFGPIRVRKASSVLPAITAADSEEAVSMPVFSDTTLSAKGNIILRGDALSGYYLSGPIVADEPVRIIVPNWQLSPDDQATVKAAVSADSGATFKEDCAPGSFYYASRKDFTAGSNLKIRLDLSRASTIISDSGVDTFSLDYRPGKITVISPNGGEVWPQGSEREITWSADEYESTYPFNILYSADSGKNYTAIVSALPNSGNYVWPVASDATTNAFVKVADALEEKVYDVSDKKFSVSTQQASSDYLLTGEGKWNEPSAWATGVVPGLASDVSLASSVTITADSPIAFRSLSIGDGKGEVTTTLILKAGINPNSGEMIVRKGGKVIQDNTEALVFSGNLTVKNAGLLTHASGMKLDLSAKNINIEPGAKVIADGLDSNNGGQIKLTAAQNFYIYSLITADGASDTGANGGKITLTAEKFGGENANIHATGANSETKGGNGGELYVTGKGTISGTVNVNAGSGVENGKGGKLEFK